MYDVLESDVHKNGVNGSRYAEKGYLGKFVCLNEKGKLQARAMGEHIKHIGLPIGYVISSPICRARQTAEIAFNRYDKLDRMLVHRGPFNESESKRVEVVKNIYLQLPIVAGTNTVISGHGSTVVAEMFDDIPNRHDLTVGEGGFFVISREAGKLKLEHQFYTFPAFVKGFYKR